MIETKTQKNWVPYLVMSFLFMLSIVFNEYIDIAGVRPDILLIMLVFLASRQKPFIAICCAFAFGLLHDVFLPGDFHYWGLSPLLKTLLIYGFLKLHPLFSRLKGITYQACILASFIVYFAFYNMLYYSGYAKPFMIFFRYSLPETVYTFVVYLLLIMLFPRPEQTR